MGREGRGRRVNCREVWTSVVVGGRMKEWGGRDRVVEVEDA